MCVKNSVDFLQILTRDGVQDNMEFAPGKAEVLWTPGPRNGAITTSKSQSYCLPCCHNGEDSQSPLQ